MAEETISQIVTIARYAEGAGMATTAVSAQVAASCSGNSATATRLQDARKIIFTNDAETEVVFDGSADLIISLKNKKAEGDALGNNIVETYATKNELKDYAKTADVSATYATKTELEDCATKIELNDYAKNDEVAETYATKSDLQNYATKTDLNDYAKNTEVSETYVKKNKLADYVAKADFNFSFEKVDDVPYLSIEVGGKKYRFSGVEVS